MKSKRQPQKNKLVKFEAVRRFLCFTVVLFTVDRSLKLFANPTGMTVGAGSATAQQLGSQLNVTTSQAAFLNWSSFNIKPGETTTFIQPSANSVVFNQIGGANPSQIFGNLNANGTVILANANGFYFGPNSMISVGGSFIATTAPLTPDFGASSAWQFTGMPPLAAIVNYGQIKVGEGKSLYLIAEQIENHGGLDAPGGDIGLYAGQSVLVSERPDGRGLSATMKLPSGSVNNFGQITASAGSIALQAQVVNQNGILQADSVQNQNGVIELVASDSLNLGADSQILARGDDSASGSSGGTVTLKSENNFSDSINSQIFVTGGTQGGNGGNLEVSAPNVLTLNSSMNATAQSGWSGGTFFLDPVNIILGTSTAGGAINVNTAFAGFSTILLQATGNITLNANTVWNLSSSTGNTTGQLTLEAGGDITFGNNSKIFDANNWSVTLDAGYNFINNTIQSGVGNIYLNGGSGLAQNGSIQLSAGDINLSAGQSILLASPNTHSTKKISGSVFTTGGGNIFAYAMAGDIDTGTSNGGTSSTTQTSDYRFDGDGTHVNPVLGGISTAAGGNVTLIAGNNIDSTPLVPSKQWAGASGAYGVGDVTIIAGNQITGNYTLANGIGTMLAGVQVKSGQAGILQNSAADHASTLHDLETAVTQTPNLNGNIGGVEYAGQSRSSVTLSLIQGSWNAWAANNIFLKEVNNPNGIFNSAQSYLYNYAPDAAAHFWAGNTIELAGGTVGGTLVRNGNPNIIYAPILTLDAGAGGIIIDKSIILAPSSEGSLEITTRNGGNLSSITTVGVTPTLNGITMSDSDSTSYKTFASGHVSTPLHLNDPNPVVMDISGSIESFSLTVPTFADINVGGDTYNFGFNGRNLSAAQTTAINVVGNIAYQPLSIDNQNVTLGNQGLTVAGPGIFSVSAQNIDLGVSGGISVLAPDAALGAISPYGANLDVTVSGNLAMTSTKIANEGYLGGINLNVGGSLAVGGEFTASGAPNAAKGIFTTSGGNVNVTVNGDVNVNSSRIAAYDGGTVTVTSLNGDINAGVGGAGYVSFNALELNSKHQLIAIPATIPGSGILATTVVGSHAALGDITLDAPNGSINASKGGVLQIAFNSADTRNNFIDVNAAHDITASGSGIIGYNINLKAGGDIKGLVIGRESVAINAQQNVNVTAFSGGNVDISAAGNISGTVISGGSVNASGDSITASLISDSISTSGNASGASEGVPQSNVAQNNAQTADNATDATSKDDTDDSDLKKRKPITLAQKVGRVTVVLPTKN